MIETYQCPDGRAVLLTFNEDHPSVGVSNQEGETIGSYRFALVGPDGAAIDVMDDTGGAVSFKLAQNELHDAWHHQGITERVMNLVAEEISASPHAPSHDSPS